MKKLISCLTVMFVFTMAVYGAQAQTLYITGFEEPEIETGVLDGQDGWALERGVAEDAQVVTSFGSMTPYEGSQMLAFYNSNPADENRRTYMEHALFTDTAGDINPFTYDMMMAHSDVEHNNFMGNFIRAGAFSGYWFGFRSQDMGDTVELYARSDQGGIVYSGVTAAENTWYHFQLDKTTLNDATLRVFDGFGGAELWSQDLEAGNTTMIKMELMNEWRAGDDPDFTYHSGTLYVDAIPEPSTLALLGLAGLLLLKRRRV